MDGPESRRDGRHTDTRERIMSTALRLFTERGYGGTSLKDIADELGITKAAVYYHFPAKADLARSLFTPFITDVDAALAPLAGRRPSAREAFSAVLEALLPHRLAFAALMRDPGALGGIDLTDAGTRWVATLTALVVGPDPSPEERVRVGLAIGGLTRIVILPGVDADVIRSAGVDAAVGAVEGGGQPAGTGAGE